MSPKSILGKILKVEVCNKFLYIRASVGGVLLFFLLFLWWRKVESKWVRELHKSHNRWYESNSSFLSIYNWKYLLIFSGQRGTETIYDLLFSNIAPIWNLVNHPFRSLSPSCKVIWQGWLPYQAIFDAELNLSLCMTCLSFFLSTLNLVQFGLFLQTPH